MNRRTSPLLPLALFAPLAVFVTSAAAGTYRELVEFLAAVPDDEMALGKRLGISASDKVGATHQESLQYPSFNVRGLSASDVGAKAYRRPRIGRGRDRHPDRPLFAAPFRAPS